MNCAFPANACNGPFNIEHSATVSPNQPRPTGTEFSLSCMEGYSASIKTGSIICDESNVWKNMPSCQGKSGFLTPPPHAYILPPPYSQMHCIYLSFFFNYV